MVTTWFQPEVFPVITHFSPSFYLFITDNCNSVSLLREAIKMKIFFSLLTIIYPKIDMKLLKQFCLGNNLAAHIRENTDPLGKASEIDECLGEFQML